MALTGKGRHLSRYGRALFPLPATNRDYFRAAYCSGVLGVHTTMNLGSYHARRVFGNLNVSNAPLKVPLQATRSDYVRIRPGTRSNPSNLSCLV